MSYSQGISVMGWLLATSSAVWDSRTRVVRETTTTTTNGNIVRVVRRGWARGAVYIVYKAVALVRR